MMEQGYRSPIYKERVDQEEFISICMEILRNARNELYLSMRFLDVSLSSLYFVADPSVQGTATDGSCLYFAPEALASMYRSGRVWVNRAYLHSIFHCLFCHMWTRKKRAEEYWNLACDIAVESIIDKLYRPCIHMRMSPFRQEFYGRLERRISVLNAEGVYHALQEMGLSESEYLRLTQEFCRDDHCFWGKDDDEKPSPKSQPKNNKNDWDDKREKMQVEMEAFANEATEDDRDLLDQLAVENRERYDYREFLRKFSIIRETVQVDPDAFDYVFYHYGMELYGNMPLIEPLETKEIRRVEDFVIVIDTSMSCSGDLVRKFLEETYSVLSQSESFFKKVNIHIIQCDDQIREDVTVHDHEELQAYMDNLQLHGMGGTDFRPPFLYVDQLIKQQRFRSLKGLIYFTDGYGVFPVKRPVYDTAFVFMKDNYSDVDVPPWAIKIILSPEELGTEVKEIKNEY